MTKPGVKRNGTLKKGGASSKVESKKHHKKTKKTSLRPVKMGGLLKL